MLAYIYSVQLVYNICFGSLKSLDSSGWPDLESPNLNSVQLHLWSGATAEDSTTLDTHNVHCLVG